MKAKNRISGAIINCSLQHYDQVLSKQGWIDVPEEVVQPAPAPKKKAGRPKKVN